ncbi:MAG: hypothetical protein RLZZ272_10 [Actinomycetota bacterium]|jgi:predicted amidophosphoribosyltransferase
MPWCPRCAAEVVALPAGCPRCAGVGLGHACFGSPAAIDATVAAYDYRGVVSAAIVTAKLGGARSGWAGLAEALAQRVAASALEVDVITWVTTDPRRARQRGGDHAFAIARAVADRVGLPLARLLDAKERPGGGDRYRARHALPATDVLLVDDVMTTGRTALAAASALRRAGAGGVTLAVIARAGDHPLGAVARDPRPGTLGRHGLPSGPRGRRRGLRRSAPVP